MFDLLQAMAIIEPAAMDSLKNRGSGAGPFKFAEWVPGDRTTLERNTAYWGQGVPWADRVVFKVFSDSDAMVAALQSGICDLIIAVPPKDTARLAKEFNMVRGTPGALTYEVRVNGAKPPFDEKEARQALHYAIDRQGIVNNVLFGVSEPTVSVQPELAGVDRSTLAKYPFDLKRAKEMLEKAGVAGAAECLTLPQFPDCRRSPRCSRPTSRRSGSRSTSSCWTQRSTTSGCWAATPTLPVLLGEHAEVPDAGRAQQHLSTRRTTPSGATRCRRRISTPSTRPTAPPSPPSRRWLSRSSNTAILDEAWVLSIAYRQSVFGLAKHVDGFAYTMDDMAVLENVSLEK